MSSTDDSEVTSDHSLSDCSLNSELVLLSKSILQMDTLVNQNITKQNWNQNTSVVKKIALLYKEKLGIEHVNILNNNWAYAGQEIFHIHFHIIPRDKDDGQQRKKTLHPERREEFETLLQALQE